MCCRYGDVLCASLCMLEAVEGGLCLLEMLEAMRRVLLCALEAVEGRLCLLDVLEVMRRVLWRPWRVSSVCWRYWR